LTSTWLPVVVSVWPPFGLRSSAFQLSHTWNLLPSL
jgi:hypothetical protein